MKIVRGRLSAADVSNPYLRYNPDCDCMQYTPDNGATWADTPSLDPRHGTMFLKPPLETDDPKCDAAANMVKWFKDFIDQALEVFVIGGTITTLINTFLFALDFLAPYAEIIQLVVEGAGTIFGIGATALTAAFTSTEYDALQCIFFCNADDMGQISVDSLAEIESEITDQLNTTAALVTNLILSIQGEIGLSNAGAIGSETGDCDTCGCTTTLCVGFNDGDVYEFYENPAGALAPVGSLDTGFGNPLPSGHSGQNVSYGSYQMWVSVRIDLGAPVNLTDATFQFYFSSNVGDAIYRAFYFLDNDSVEIAHWDASSGQTQNEWLAYDYAGDPLTGVRYVVALLGQSSGTTISGDIWVDNICATWSAD